MTEYTPEDAKDIFYGDDPQFGIDPVAKIDMGERRWHHDWRHIMERTDGTLWAVDGAIGLTERQENMFEDAPFQVFAREVEIPARTEIHYFTSDDVDLSE